MTAANELRKLVREEDENMLDPLGFVGISTPQALALAELVEAAELYQFNPVNSEGRGRLVDAFAAVEAAFKEQV